MQAIEVKNETGGTYCTIAPDSDRGIVKMDFQGYVNGEEMKTAMLDSYPLYTENPGVYHAYLVDISRVEGPFGDNEWAKKEWTPMVIKAGVIGSAAVVGEDIFSKMSAEQIAEMKIGNYKRKVFDDATEATNWLHDLRV